MAQVRMGAAAGRGAAWHRRVMGRGIAVSLTMLGSVWLAGCGGGGADASTSGATAVVTTPATGTPATTPTTPATTTPASVSAVLNLDLGVLANYAAPTLPAYYDDTVTALDNTPAGDPVDNRLATLGRVLFYERALSINGTVSCASCHQQAQAFGDTRRFSLGFAGGQTTATAMRLGNVRYYRPGTMFWDKRAASVEAQAVQPIQNGVEMGFDDAHGGLTAALSQLQSKAYIADLFTFAFGDSTVTATRLQRALAHFERAMVSSDSRWDRGYAANFNAALGDRGLGLPIAGFTAQEDRGRALFMLPVGQGGAGCAGCHQPPTFALAPNARSNGLDAGETVVFKSPSLKGVGRSGAFMHDGRFSTLAQVVEHRDNGVQAGPALDNRLIAGNGLPRRLNLSAADKAALVAFMQTLDDTTLRTDARFSDPFRR